MLYHFKMHAEKKGYWAECIELKGCLTRASTKKELLENAVEALNLFLDEPECSKVIFPEPIKPGKRKNLIEVAVDPKIATFFAVQARIKRTISAFLLNSSKALCDFTINL